MSDGFIHKEENDKNYECFSKVEWKVKISNYVSWFDWRDIAFKYFRYKSILLLEEHINVNDPISKDNY